MNYLILLVMSVSFTCSMAQNSSRGLDPTSYGVVLDHPDMNRVKVRKDVVYFSDEKSKLCIDLYSPPGLKPGEKRPAIVFLLSLGNHPEEKKIKDWAIYSTWPRLMAAHGYTGISMETDGTRVMESYDALFAYIRKHSAELGIDAERIGVYAASANVTFSSRYLMSDKAYPGIKAAVLYYGISPSGPFRKDLPVMYVLAEGDVQSHPENYLNLWPEVLKNNAPWTIRMGTALPHGFDAYSDNEEARKMVRETISFWKNHLDPVPKPEWNYDKGRDAIGNLQMNRPKAIELLKELVQENPKDISTLNFYSDALRNAKMWGELKKVYEKILEIDPGHVQTLISMAALMYQENQNGEAEKYQQAALKSGKMNRNHYALLAYHLLVVGKNKESAGFYEKALAMEPRGVDYYNLACAYAKINDADKALSALEKTVKMGYGNRQQFESDPDLNSIKTDQRFKNLLLSLKF